jgi:soluble lytic murein transglycosylase-like protein
MKALLQWGSVSGVTALLWGWCISTSSAADVYETRGSDNVPIYSTQRIDASSQMMLKGRQGADAASAPKSTGSMELRKRRDALEPMILDVARRVGIEAALVRAIAHVESRFNADARSPAGAEGVMQLMPGTARRYGVTNRRDPFQNLEAGARYFKDLLAQYGGNVALALAAYNSGESNVERHARRVPPFRETMLYVPEVLTQYQTYRQAEAAESAK